MIITKHVRFLESFHIPLWLLKDAFWMLDMRIPAMVMIAPTISVAVWIAWVTRHNRMLFLPNVAVCFWINANITWMLGEYVGFDSKVPAAAFFCLGFVVVL